MISIGKMAKLCHTSVQTLRWYDHKHLLEAAYVNRKNNYRYYELDQLLQFQMIRFLHDEGMPLSDIYEILHDQDFDLTSFWQGQVEKIKQRIAKEHQKLQLAQDRVQKSEIIKLLESHLDHEPYMRKIIGKTLDEPVTKRITPLNNPELAIAYLNRLIVAKGQVPNFEYGFTFRGDQYYDLSAIHYHSIFKELSSTHNINLSGIKNISGEYLCIAFRWSTKDYLQYLHRLLVAYKNRAKRSFNGSVYEESYQLNYLATDFSNYRNSIVELRIPLD